ncbi:fucose isomerase [Oscillospiraceae bacterium MB08-C2-2]|nr:fucose isomerase [Oscillospiraceae bacterium MB08-C2-2]
MKKVTLGVVCLVRTTYDHKAAQEIYNNKMEELRTKLPEVDFVFEEQAVIEVEDAQAAAQKMLAANVDGLVIISGTFHLGHLALVLAKHVRKPILLWAFNELPYDGGKIRLNAVCGLNLNASNLYKAGYDNISYTIGDWIDEEWLKALRAKVVLDNAHVGIVGYRAHGFFNVGSDDLDVYRKTGILIDHYEIADMFGQPVSEQELDEEEVKVRKLFTTKDVTDEQVRKVAGLCVSIEKFMDKNKLDCVAVRCWPEFAATYGVSPCASMSVVQSRGRILSCEGDIEGALSMLVTKALGVETPYLADLSQVDLEENFALMWHCGVAPANLWDGKSDRSLDTYFAGGKGVTAGFVMMDGHINMMRIDTARGKTRMFMCAGDTIPMEKQLTGTYVKVRFEQSMDELLESVISNGFAHHVAFVYGEYRSILKRFAQMMNFEVIE